MIVLGFDTATHATVAGLRLPDGSTLCARDDPAPGEQPGHATRLLGMIERLLTSAGISWGALDRIAVGLGPGRFTGLRVGVATARGLAQARSLELVGVSTLQALAAGALRAGAEGHERVLAVIDALRGEVFAAGYAREGEPLCERPFSRALSPGELAGQLACGAGARPGDGDRHLIERWLAIGDGAVRYRSQLAAGGAVVPPEGSALHAIDGAAICDLAEAAQPVTRYEELLPDYRRAPDARVRAPGGGAEQEPRGAAAGAAR